MVLPSTRTPALKSIQSCFFCARAELVAIFAVGAGAVTKLVDREVPKIERIFMPKYPFEYLRDDHRQNFEKDYADKVREFFEKYPI